MYAVIPNKAKPSKSLSTDRDRPVLTSATLRKTDDGWELCGTDSYKLARVPLDVCELEIEPELTEGPISAEALKAIEKAGGGFRANGTVEPLSADGVPTGQTFTRPDCGRFPNVDQLMPDPPAPEDKLEIGLNAKFLYDLAQALGGQYRVGSGVRITIDLGKTQSTANGRTLTRPMVVRALNDAGASGLLMPVRVTL